jgi:hypothetical protein
MEDATVNTFGKASKGQLGHGDIEVNQLTPKTVKDLVGVRSCSAREYNVSRFGDCLIAC